MTQAKIFTMLENDHHKVDQLFEELEKTTTRGPKGRKEIFNEIDMALSTHADFEEREVYPLLADKKASKSTMLEAVEEHLLVKNLLAELRELDPQDERWMAKAKVLMENVRHHVKEEEDELFSKLRKDASADTLKDLAQQHQVLEDQAVK